MKVTKLIPVLLAGGIGSRLWPLSREHYPKQLLTLLGDDSLLQATIRRLSSGLEIEQLIVICNEEHRFDVLQQLEQLDLPCPFRILLEPVGRGTAPAAALAAMSIADDDATLLFMPADHVIQPQQTFITTVQHACRIAGDSKLLTFGIQPTYPETGYGYIHVEEQMADGSYQIAQFVEKPDLATAQKFIKSGGYYWNSGMFCFPRTLFLEELALCAPDIYHATQKAAKTLQADGYFFRTDSELFAHIPDQSLDYALMEHTKRGFMLPLAIQWSDIGSWESLFNYEQKDPQGNVHVGDVLSIDNKNCYLRSEQRLLAAVGLENVIVVQTGDCVLVVDKQQSQKVKEIVKQLKHHHRPEAVRHLVQYHPWGTTTLLNAGDGFTINRVDINPMQRLSLHHHEHRSEHWLVLSGEAKVTINDVEKIYEKGTSFFIPLQSRHSIANTTDAIISLVEVQAGHFVAEDIYRYE